MKLTEKVRQKVVYDILNGKYAPGDKIPTEREMTVITRTSRITVRRAYEQLEKSGVIERKPKLGTRVADSFKGNQQDIDEVGVIATLRSQYSRDFIESVHDTCMENDAMINLALAETSAGQLEAAVKLFTRGLRNLIIWGYDRNIDFDTFERLRALGMNIVFFDRVIPGPFADFVGLDNEDAVIAMFEDADEHGIKKFIYVDIAGQMDSNRERLDCFEQQCLKRGSLHDRIVVPFLPHDETAPEDIMRNYLAEHDCSADTAIICVNDAVALSILAACPGDMPVYGIDGTPKALLAGIISYRQPIREMAAAAVKALENQQKKGDKWKAKKIRFKGKLMRH